VLQPAEVTDPNGNRAAVAFDVLGLVAGTAVMGKTSESLGDSLPASRLTWRPRPPVPRLPTRRHVNDERARRVGALQTTADADESASHACLYAPQMFSRSLS
jgi:hypothetical protein